MKKYLIIAAAALISLAACKQETEEEALAKFEGFVLTEMRNFRTNVTEANADSLGRALTETILDASFSLIKKFPSGKTAVEALNVVHRFGENEDVEKAVGMLKGLDEDPLVAKLKASVEAKKGTKEGMMFTDFEVNGVKFSDYIGKGKYVLVDFWASWCGPCKGEIPNIASVYEKYAGADFDVLSIAVWDKPEDTIASAKEHGVVWNQIIDAQTIPTEIYGIDGIPQIMLFGPDGTILKRDLRGAGIEEAVKAALGR